MSKPVPGSAELEARTPDCGALHTARRMIVDRVCEHVAASGLSPTRGPMDASALPLHADAVEPISTVTGRNNVVVRLPGKGGGRSLILTCHLDTHPEGDAGQWRYPPYSGEIDAQTNAIY